MCKLIFISDLKYENALKTCSFCFCCFFLPVFQYTSTFIWHEVKKKEIYSMLISRVHAESKLSLHSDHLKSSSPTDWSNFPLHFLLPLHVSCKCDNVLCSEIRTISVHLAPNVSKKPVSFSGWMVDVGKWLIARVDLGKRTPMEESCLTACHQLFKAKHGSSSQMCT